MTQAYKQFLINELSTAYKAFVFEQVGSASYLMALKANGIEVTEERTKWHTIVLNEAIANLYDILRKLGKRVGKTPVRKFDAATRCTASCKNARGYECVCSCSGIFHGISNL